jgi:hypothetical protein
MQTCQETRKEFLPMWLKNRRLHLEPRWLSQYLSSFIYSHLGAENQVANLKLTNKIPHTWYYKTISKPFPWPRGVDILPLLQLSATSPQFHFSCDQDLDFFKAIECMRNAYPSFRSVVDAGHVKQVRVCDTRPDHQTVPQGTRITVVFTWSDAYQSALARGDFRGKNLGWDLDLISEMELWPSSDGFMTREF